MVMYTTHCVLLKLETYQIFYSAFNSIFHRAGKLKDEQITVQLINSFCKPYLLYATECIGLSSTHMHSLRHTWQSAISHVFNITGEPVNLICSIIDDNPLDLCIIHRRIKFLQNIICYLDGNTLLKTVFMYAGCK